MLIKLSKKVKNKNKMTLGLIKYSGDTYLSVIRINIMFEKIGLIF